MLEIQSALNELVAPYKYRIELHAHTDLVSPCGELSPEELVLRLHNKNYHTVVITDHFREGIPCAEGENPVTAFIEGYKQAKAAGEKYGMTVLLGAEYSFEQDNDDNEYLLYGIDEAFLYDTYDTIHGTLREFSEKYRDPEKRLIIQAHPRRSGNVPADPKYLDGMEIFNMHPDHNSRVSLASAYAGEHNISILTAATDLHDPDFEGVAAILAKIQPKTNEQLLALLRSQDYLLEVGGRVVLPHLYRI